MKTTNHAPSVALATLGCKVNQYESASLAAAFEDKGFRVLPFTEAADCYIVNTCTVTNRTDYQSRQMIRRAVRRNPDALVVVTGCYAQINAEALAGISGVTVIAGNSEKSLIPVIVADLWEKKQGGKPLAPAPGNRIGSSGNDEAVFTPGVERFPDHTRAFLKIQDGCNAFCSYCIVPHARGRSRSLPPDEVFRRISRLTAAGYQEIVLTGIHLGFYGQDLTPKTRLIDILRQIEERRMLKRLRLSSIEPLEVTDDLLSLFAASAVICPHLHIPLQSGDDAILSLMNRHYDAAFFKVLVEKVVAARPDSALGLDVMVGFPGEEEKAFENTYQLIEALPITYLHIFPYSNRPGTPAASMKGQVREEDKKRRAHLLRKLDHEKRRAFMERFMGRPLQVLLEGRVDKKTGHYKGFSQNYIPVTVVNGHPDLINAVVPVMPHEISGTGLIGSVIHA